MFRMSLCAAVLLPVAIFGGWPRDACAQDEGLPAIAREVYRPHTELPPASAPRVVTERVVAEPPILPPKVVDDTPAVGRASVTPRSAVVAPAVVVAAAPSLGRYSFGFYNDGNADDNWYYDYYEAPQTATAVVVKPITDAAPGFRTNWTYAPLFERGLFSW